MACVRKSIDQMVTCPYNKEHRLRSSRLQFHISKCRLNNLDKEMDICPFNATHVMPRGTLAEHIAGCADRMPVDREASTQLDRNNAFKGRTAVPSYSHPLPPSEEVWDDEGSVPFVKYVPPTPAEDVLIPDLGMMKPAARKNYYQSRFTEEAKANEIPSTKPVQDPLRQPQKKFVDILSKEKLDLSASTNLGLGRGLPRTEDTTTTQQQSTSHQLRQPSSYRELMAGNNPSLGIGRGRRPPAASSSLVSSFGQGAFPSNFQN